MTQRRRKGIVFGIVGLLAVLVVGGFFGIGHVERTLTEDSKAWLSARGETDLSVDAKGREIVLTGTASPGTDPKVLGDELKSQLVHTHDHWWSFNDDPGVRIVDTSGVSAAPVPVEPEIEAEPEATPEPEPTVAVVAMGTVDALARLDGDAIVLSGSVLSEAQRNSLVSAAEAEFGADNVIDELQVLDVEPKIDGADARVDELAALLPVLHGRMNGQASLQAQDLSITGVALDPDAVDDITAAAMGLSASNPTVEVTGPATVALDDETQSEAAEAIEGLDLTGVQFESGTATLTAEAEGILDGVAEQLNAYPDVRVGVAGHTDSEGDEDFNLDLSQRRAEAVVDYLGTKGVDTGRLVPEGFGEADPIASNETQDGRAQNRRVELTVLEGN